MYQLVQLSPPVSRIIAAQAGLTFAVSALALFLSVEQAYSALLGGVSVVAPGVVAAGIYERSAGRGLRPIIQGELWKFVLSIGLFIGVFTLVSSLSAKFFFGTFILVQTTYAWAPLLEARRLRNRPKS